MQFVIFVNGIVILFCAGLMGLDALAFPDTAAVFGISFILAAAFGLSITLAVSKTLGGDLTRAHTFLLTSTVWFSAAMAGALPLYLWDLSLIDAIFESVSGVTTTGSTVMSGLDDTPRGILMWRAVLQALGGVGFVVTAMALLPMLKVGGMQLYQSESSEQGEKQLRSTAEFALATLGVYVGLMALCFFFYSVGGMGVFDAVTHAMTTLSSGGYSNYDASFGHFTSPFLQWTSTIFMLAAGLPFAWYIRMYTRGVFRSEQVIAMLWSLSAVILALTLWMVLGREYQVLTALRLVSFNVVSVVTTTGYATADYAAWGTPAAVAFFLLTAVGGCTGSTAGGAKAMRWIILLRSTFARMRQIYQPHGVFITRYDGRPVTEDVLSGVMAFFFFYVATVGLLAVALDLLGLDFTTSLTGALTAVANVGPGLGEIIGPAGNFAPLSGAAKAVLAFGMFVGRLEMMTVFILFLPRFWRGF